MPKNIRYQSGYPKQIQERLARYPHQLIEAGSLDLQGIGHFWWAVEKMMVRNNQLINRAFILINTRFFLFNKNTQ
jgi:hypothetical protein